MGVTSFLTRLPQGSLTALNAHPSVLELLREARGDMYELHEMVRESAGLDAHARSELAAFLEHRGVFGLECCLFPTVRLDKSWVGIHYLLTGLDPIKITEPKDVRDTVLLGCTRLMGTGAMVPPSTLSSTQVQDAWKALEPLENAYLRTRFDSAKMMALAIYPPIWSNEADALAYLDEHYQALRSEYQEAAECGEAMLISWSV